MKIENLIRIFFIFLLETDCGYTLEPPRRGGSNEYPQSMFWSKNKKNGYTPANPSFAIYIKVGFKGVYITWTCFPDEGQLSLKSENKPGQILNLFHIHVFWLSVLLLRMKKTDQRWRHQSVTNI